MVRHPRFRHAIVIAVVAAAAAWAAAWAGASIVVPADLRADDFDWSHEPGETKAITDAKCLELPLPFGDADLLATVELPEGGELDIVVRRVEPRLRRLAAAPGKDLTVTEELVPFHGRFTLLRLSAAREGPPWRSRDQALFSPELAGGILVKGGVPASVELSMRGRTLRANVAGRPLPAMTATDDHGSLAFVVRGGTALLRYLKVRVRPTLAELPRWLWAGLLGGLAAGVALWLRMGHGRAVVALLAAALAGAWVARVVLFDAMLPWTRPDLWVHAALPAAALPLGLAMAKGARRLAVLAALVWLGSLEFAVRHERPRLQPFETVELARCFGDDSGVAPFDALARRLSSQSAVHTLAGPASRVLFLGGSAMFQATPDLTAQLGLRTALALQQQLGREVEGIVAPTALGSVVQQVRLFRQFYQDMQPQVVVLGLANFESAIADPQPWPIEASLGLVEFARRRSGPQRTPLAVAHLTQALDQLGALCAARSLPLVLACQDGLDPAWLAELERWTTAQRVPLVRGALAVDGIPRFEPLAAAVLPLLR